MPYRVFENDKRCNDFNIEGWDNDTFPTLEKAQKYAVEWCNPCMIVNYKDWPHPTQLDVEVNMSYCEFPVMMSIKKVD